MPGTTSISITYRNHNGAINVEIGSPVFISRLKSVYFTIGEYEFGGICRFGVVSCKEIDAGVGVV